MTKLNSALTGLRRTVLAILLVAVLLLMPARLAHAAVDADYSASPGAPDYPSQKQKTLYGGRADRNIVTGGDQARGNSDRMINKIEKTLDADNSDRPKTTGEWNRESRKTEDRPGTRGERIVKESGEALKDFGSMYKDTAERSGQALEEQSR
jgi:uncharacterized membrane protein YdfJ with MMPL/SSD domain